MTCKVDYTYITQLKLQNKKKVILLCNTSPKCQCSVNDVFICSFFRIACYVEPFFYYVRWILALLSHSLVLLSVLLTARV